MLARLNNMVATGASPAPNTVVRTHILSVRRLPLSSTPWLQGWGTPSRDSVRPPRPPQPERAFEILAGGLQPRPVGSDCPWEGR